MQCCVNFGLNPSNKYPLKETCFNGLVEGETVETVFVASFLRGTQLKLGC